MEQITPGGCNSRGHDRRDPNGRIYSGLATLTLNNPIMVLEYPQAWVIIPITGGIYPYVETGSIAYIPGRAHQELRALEVLRAEIQERVEHERNCPHHQGRG